MTYLIKDLPELEKPREKLKKYGIEYLSIEDLIAIVLRCGTKNLSVKDLAIKITKEFPDLKDITLPKLEKISGMGEVKAITLMAAMELGKRCIKNNTNRNIKLNKADTIYDYFKDILINLKQEHLITVFLDSKMNLINYKTVFIGTANMSITHPREVFKNAIDNSAVYIIMIHNHPSGEVYPSKQDIEFTKRVLYTSKVIGIPILDHLIIGKDKYYSFYDNGELNEEDN